MIRRVVRHIRHSFLLRSNRYHSLYLFLLQLSLPSRVSLLPPLLCRRRFLPLLVKGEILRSSLLLYSLWISFLLFSLSSFSIHFFLKFPPFIVLFVLVAWDFIPKLPEFHYPILNYPTHMIWLARVVEKFSISAPNYCYIYQEIRRGKLSQILRYELLCQFL